MRGFTGFGSSPDETDFASYDEATPETLPDPGPFLADHAVLTGRDHAAFHRLTRGLFEERAVYDMTFNYNLARLNLDTRHPDAGFRYAVESGDEAVLRSEFTPTTPFCPQTHTLTLGAFRAWNELRDRHEFRLVRVRAAPMHHRSQTINTQLVRAEDAFRKTGVVPGREDLEADEGEDRIPDAPF